MRRPYTSSLPVCAGAARLLIGVRPLPGARADGPDELERLRSAAATGELRFALAVAAPLGRFRDVGVIHVGRRLPDEADRLAFSPWNTGGGLAPAGLLDRLRDYAYPCSQRGWGARLPRA
ncbi:MAG TPA: hypothetical protein VNT03_00185 [Baekduia sp.]|nr:hypothetical protein [Baekduia sp.]